MLIRPTPVCVSCMGGISPTLYRNPKVLDGQFAKRIPPGKTESRFQTFISRFDRMAATAKDDFADHFRKKYSDPMPLWVAVELWDFGMLSVFISGLKYRDQKAIADRYGLPRPQLLPTWVRALSYVRTICAHHTRLWNLPTNVGR